MTRNVTLGDRRIGPNRPPYVLAAATTNHDGDPGRAEGLIAAAAAADADGITFAVHEAERVVTPGVPARWTDRTQRAAFRDTELPAESLPAVVTAARDRGLDPLATPFDAESVSRAATAGVAGFRIPSGEVTHERLLRAVGRTGLPVVVTTGTATVAETRAAVETLAASGAGGPIVCHAVAERPTPVDRANLGAVERFAETFDTPVGSFDRTPGTTTAVAAVALGARLVATPFTDDATRAGPSPFHETATEPAALAALVARVRNAARATRGGPEPTDAELDARRTDHRSLVTRREVTRGSKLTRSDLTVKRPGHGIDPRRLDDIARGGWRATTRLPPDAVLTWDDVRRE